MIRYRNLILHSPIPSDLGTRSTLACHLHVAGWLKYFYIRFDITAPRWKNSIDYIDLEKTVFLTISGTDLKPKPESETSCKPVKTSLPACCHQQLSKSSIQWLHVKSVKMLMIAVAGDLIEDCSNRVDLFPCCSFPSPCICVCCV